MIPYQLAQPAEVTVSIYSADGKLVRALVLVNYPWGCIKAVLVQRIGMAGMHRVSLLQAVSISIR